jgi:acyl carrier protein
MVDVDNQIRKLIVKRLHGDVHITREQIALEASAIVLEYIDAYEDEYGAMLDEE